MKETFLFLFKLASSKDATVADLWEEGGNGGHWLVYYKRLARLGKVGDV